MSPFVALYGHEPRHWGIDATYTCSTPSLKEWLDQLKAVQQLLQQNLHYARQYMKIQADKKRSERTFQLGEEVFVKLQPYVQSSVVSHPNNKLAFRYFGPFAISKCINPVVYEVALPPASRIHPVFHVSQLRKVLKQGMTPSLELPVPIDIAPIPVKFLGHRWRQTPTGRRAQVQVQWSVGTNPDVTWEDKIQLQQKFPETMAWGQAMSQGEGDVSTSTEAATDKLEMGLANRSTRPKRIPRSNRRLCGPEWTK
jgi:hypothetical protein